MRAPGAATFAARRLFLRPTRHTLPDWLNRHLAGYALLFPACLLVLGLVAYPLGYTIWLSFTNAQEFDGPGAFNGLANYRDLLTDRVFWEAVQHTVLLSGLTIVLQVLLGVATALLLWWRFWGRSLVFLAVFVPWAFPAVFSAFAWYWIFTPPFHTFYTVDALHLRHVFEQVLGSSAWFYSSILTLNVWRGSSFIAIFLLAGLNGIPKQLLEYARLECESPWQQFWYVVAPLLRRFFVLAVLVSLVITFMDYTTVYIETGGRIFQPLLGTNAYQESILQGHTGLGAAITVIQLPVIALLLFFGFRAFDREPAGYPSDRAVPAMRLTAGRPSWWRGTQAAAARPLRVRRYRLRYRLLLVAGGAFALFMAVFHLFPIYWTVIQAVRPVAEDVYGNPFWVRHPSLEGFTETVGNRAFWTWMQNTAVIWGGALSLALVTSILAGYSLARLQVPGYRWIARLLLASYFVPQTAVVVPVYQVFLWLGISDTSLAVVLLYQTLTIPFCTWLFYSYYSMLPADTEEAALLDGSRVQAFLRLTLRMSWPVVVAAGVFSVGMMASDLLYAGTFLVHHNQQTATIGLGVISFDLDEFNTVTGGIGLAALPLVLICLLFAPSYVRGLTMAMEEGA